MKKSKARPVYNKEWEEKIRQRLVQMTELSRSIDPDGTVTSPQRPFCIASKALLIVLSVLRDVHTDATEIIKAVFSKDKDNSDNPLSKQIFDFLNKYGLEGYFCILAVNDGKRYKSEGRKFMHFVIKVGIDNYVESVRRYVNVLIEQNNIEKVDVLNPNATTSSTSYYDAPQLDVHALASAIAELLKQQSGNDSK